MKVIIGFIVGGFVSLLLWQSHPQLAELIINKGREIAEARRLRRGLMLLAEENQASLPWLSRIGMIVPGQRLKVTGANRSRQRFELITAEPELITAEPELITPEPALSILATPITMPVDEVIIVDDVAGEKHFFWKPFSLMNKADRFAAYITKNSGIECLAEKTGPGTYQVYFNYSSEAEKANSIELIKETGVSL
ncbi:hypothetical protein [Desulfotalea psychrophila]|nr:hypothetical protein [Desulfotalea psychrophila]